MVGSGARTGQAGLLFFVVEAISLHTGCSHFLLCLCHFSFSTLLLFFPYSSYNSLLRSPGIAMDGMEME